jgi:hypothetical protein
MGGAATGDSKKKKKPNSMRDAPIPATHIERKDVIYTT